MTTIIAFYAIGFLCSWWLVGGTFFAWDQQGMTREAARKSRRDALGFCVAVGFFSAAIWPLGLPLAFCMTGFAEHGCWRVRTRDAE